MISAEPRTGRARVYLHPPPADGPHPGYRGEIVADAIGVHLTSDAEYIGSDAHGWDTIGIEITVPWARVDSVEWQTDDDGQHVAAARDQEWPSPP